MVQDNERNMNSPPCSTCKANCCTYVPMTKTELETLQLDKPRMISKGKIMSAGGEELVIIGKCPWVAKDHSCSAYESRPMICRMMGTAQMPCEKMEGGPEAYEKLVKKYIAPQPKGKWPNDNGMTNWKG